MMGDNNSGNSPDPILIIYIQLLKYILRWLYPLPLLYLRNQQQHLPIYVASSD